MPNCPPAEGNNPAGIYNQYVFGTDGNSLIESFRTQISSYQASAKTACSLKALADAPIELAKRLIDA